MLCSSCPPTIWATSLGLCRNRPESSADKILADVSDIFYFFSAREGGRGVRGAGRGGGVDFQLQIPGGGSPGGGGAEGPGGCLR